MTPWTTFAYPVQPWEVALGALYFIAIGALIVLLARGLTRPRR